MTGVFYYRLGEEPDYEKIREGRWLNEEPYGVVHRITTGGSHKGAGSFCLNWAFDRIGVMCGGKLSCILNAKETTEDELMRKYLGFS